MHRLRRIAFVADRGGHEAVERATIAATIGVAAFAQAQRIHVARGGRRRAATSIRALCGHVCSGKPRRQDRSARRGCRSPAPDRRRAHRRSTAPCRWRTDTAHTIRDSRARPRRGRAGAAPPTSSRHRGSMSAHTSACPGEARRPSRLIENIGERSAQRVDERGGVGDADRRAIQLLAPGRCGFVEARFGPRGNGLRAIDAGGVMLPSSGIASANVAEACGASVTR